MKIRDKRRLKRREEIEEKEEKFTVTAASGK